MLPLCSCARRRLSCSGLIPTPVRCCRCAIARRSRGSLAPSLFGRLGTGR
nr:MAG TPA: hypothetical protein [Caudoviricetes sp.]